jgi:hypothetical protein
MRKVFYKPYEMRNRIAHSLPNHIYDAATTVDWISTWDEIAELFHLESNLESASRDLKKMLGKYLKFNSAMSPRI